jgi:hypothetical protein
MLVLLTPTGGRPEGLALLAGYLNTQTWQGAARWLVVDDCDPATPAPLVRAGIEVEVMRPAWRWQPGMNTQATCMAAGLSCIEPGDTCIVLEDDDAYLPGHVAGVLAALERAELAGERVARYYNVATGRCREIHRGPCAGAGVAARGLRGRQPAHRHGPLAGFHWPEGFAGQPKRGRDKGHAWPRRHRRGAPGHLRGPGPLRPGSGRMARRRS